MYFSYRCLFYKYCSAKYNSDYTNSKQIVAAEIVAIFRLYLLVIQNK